MNDDISKHVVEMIDDHRTTVLRSGRFPLHLYLGREEHQALVMSEVYRMNPSGRTGTGALEYMDLLVYEVNATNHFVMTEK